MSNHMNTDDDLLAMERTCIDAFIGPEQLDLLLQLWQWQETPDNMAFEREFGGGEEWSSDS